MGNELFKQLTNATGLPGDLVGDELARVLKQKGISSDSLTLDELRLVRCYVSFQTRLNTQQ